MESPCFQIAIDFASVSTAMNTNVCRPFQATELPAMCCRRFHLSITIARRRSRIKSAGHKADISLVGAAEQLVIN